MKIYVLTPEERPDYRLVTTYLWHDFHNVDTSGNSYNPASREWTELTITNRENQIERIDVYPVQQSPLILVIKSNLDYLAARTAYFLARQTHGKVSTSLEGDYKEPESLLERVGDRFDAEEAMRRVKNSPFSRATLEDPYPNLRDD
jgi:hypothetical protein